MRGVALLPEELQGPDEGTCAHLPAVSVSPLIDQQRQVSVGLDPLRKHMVDHGLRGGPHCQGLLQVLATPCMHTLVYSLVLHSITVWGF